MTIRLLLTTNSEKQLGSCHLILNFCHCLQMQQRNTAVVDMEAKLSEMKSKSDEYTDKVRSCCTFSVLLQFVCL